MLTEPPTDIPSLGDITEDPQWVQEQAERLLGYEVLRKLVTVDLVSETKPGLLADKIGLDKGFIHQMLRQVKERI